MESSTRGVSPVVAVILMVAVTVILSAVIGTFVLDLGQQATDGADQSNIGVTTSNSDGKFTATVITGTANKLKLLVNGSEADNLTDPSPGDELSTTNVSPGTRITIVSVQDGERSVVSSEQISSSSTSLTTSTVPTDGLIAYWDLNGDANDSVGPYDGTVNGPTFTTGNNGQAASFDGSNDYIDLPAFSQFSAFTISVWVKSDHLDGSGEERIIEFRANNQLAIVQMHGNNPGGYTLQQHDGTSFTQLHTPSASAGVWNHLVGTWNGSTMVFYLNGTKVASGSITSMADNNAGDTMGRRSSQNDLYLAGDLDDVRVYNRSLNSSEVKDLYNSEK